MSNSTQILEGPRIEAGINVKMDTSLEHALQKNSRELSNVSGSPSSDITLERGICPHSKIVVQDAFETCYHCGVYLPKNGVKAFKSEKMNYSAVFPPKTIYETITRRLSHFKESLNTDYSQIRQTYVEWIIELAEKLGISANSQHLGIYLLDTVMYKNASLTPKIQLFAPICLLVAAKTIEFDGRIPYIPKLRRYAGSTFSVDDYRKAELQVLDLIDWNAQFGTSLEITEFLMCQGVLFSSDKIIDSEGPSPAALRENTQHENTFRLGLKSEAHKDLENSFSPCSKENNENSYSDVSTTGTNTDGTHKNIEDEVSPTYMKLAFFKQHSTPAVMVSTPKGERMTEKRVNEILRNFELSYLKILTLLAKDIEFIEWQPNIISAAAIAFLRAMNKLAQVWNDELEAMTRLDLSQISSCFELICKKYHTAFSFSAPALKEYTSDYNRMAYNTDLKLVKANSIASEKAYSSQTRYETSNILTTNFPRFSVNENSAVLQNNENKIVFNCPTKYSQATNPMSSYYLREDLKSRTRYAAHGTFNTELTQKNLPRNTIFPSNYHPSKFNTSHDTSYTTYSAAAGPTAGNVSSRIYAGTSGDNSSARNDQYPCNSSLYGSKNSGY